MLTSQIREQETANLRKHKRFAEIEEGLASKQARTDNFVLEVTSIGPRSSLSSTMKPSAGASAFAGRFMGRSQVVCF